MYEKSKLFGYKNLFVLLNSPSISRVKIKNIIYQFWWDNNQNSVSYSPQLFAMVYIKGADS